MSIELLRAGSSDSRNVLASNLFAKVFESWETNFVWLLLMAMCKKLSAGLFSCMLFVLKPYFHDLFRIFGNFDVDCRTKKTQINWRTSRVYFSYFHEKHPCQVLFPNCQSRVAKTIPGVGGDFFFSPKVSKFAQGIVIVIWQALLMAAPHGLRNKQVPRTSSFWWCDHVKKNDGCIHSIWPNTRSSALHHALQ